jgi:acyl-lipid omega-6 desaturase (Delta-12 desaturase)
MLWALAWAALHFGYWWLSLMLAVPAAGFLVRLFMIQHDCGHGSFFRQSHGKRLGRPGYRGDDA